MTKSLTTILFFLFVLRGMAQPINRLEYFFDKDSGAGKCMTLLTGSPADTIVLTTQIPVNTLASGMHTINVRAGSTDGRYGQYRSQLIYVSKEQQAAPAIVSGEYFIDHDPGVGQGSVMTQFSFSNSGNTVSQSFNLNIPGLGAGTHTLHVRVKNAAGHWSHYNDSFSILTLPLSGLYASVQRQQAKAFIQWYTLVEQNSDYFEVEKSKNGISFTTIKTIQAKGFATTTSHYTAVDDAPLPGLNYYRIKLVNKNGDARYSTIQKLWIDEGPETISIYPNPASDNVYVRQQAFTEIVFVNIYDATGKWIKSAQIPANNLLKIDVKALPKGSYTLHLSDGITSKTAKFVKH